MSVLPKSTAMVLVSTLYCSSVRGERNKHSLTKLLQKLKLHCTVGVENKIKSSGGCMFKITHLSERSCLHTTHSYHAFMCHKVSQHHCAKSSLHGPTTEQSPVSKLWICWIEWSVKPVSVRLELKRALRTNKPAEQSALPPSPPSPPRSSYLTRLLQLEFIVQRLV